MGVGVGVKTLTDCLLVIEPDMLPLLPPELDFTDSLLQLAPLPACLVLPLARLHAVFIGPVAGMEASGDPGHD